MKPNTKLGALLSDMGLWGSVALIVGVLVGGEQGAAIGGAVLAGGAVIKALIVANADGVITADEVVAALRKGFSVYDDERTPQAGSRVVVKRDE